MRDDFTKATKEKLAHRAGYRCSNPDCGIPTRGAASDHDNTINIGFAAHITAASPDGPRYDPALTADQRRHHSNGIWLCGTHGKLVDSDESHFTVEELLKWKGRAERRSFQEVVASRSSRLGPLLSAEEEVQVAFDSLLDRSKADLSGFQQSPAWPSHPIPLNLRMLDGEGTNRFAVSGLVSGTHVYDQIAVIAGPGTGKTTTLLQLVEATLANAASVAVFIPLSEWATGSDSLFQSLLRRAAYRDVSQGQFELLARDGKLLLILDGWNELDEVSRRRVRNELKGLRRDSPDIRVVISSRHPDFDIPIDGPVVEVDLLTDDQQLTLAKSLRGKNGESLMDHAWRTPGLRDLVAIPLYLSALLRQAPAGSLPTTKEEVLHSFVAELEQDRDKLATLREVLQGFHRRFLQEIAVEATQRETVSLSEAQARAVINMLQHRLKGENQIAELLQPMKLLDALVNAHMLVRSGAEAGGVSFQHQQFQEWFASFWVQQLMLNAVQGNEDAKRMLRERILDVPIWEEAVLFACDRLSRADKDGVSAVTRAILETLGIDPLLSAEMIWCSSDDVWDEIRDDVVSFVRKWHTPGRVDRAIKFMLNTGRAEFSEFVWPLVSDADDQVHLHALRAGRRFRPGVLGPDAADRIAALPEKTRTSVISEIAMYGDMSGIELATCLAKADASPEVMTSAIESLAFRRADRFCKEILESAPDDVWRALAQKWHSREFNDPEVSARIQEEADKLLAEETDPRRILSTILHARNPGSEHSVHELVEMLDFSDRDQDNRWLVHRAYELYPEEVVAGFLALLEQYKPVPFGADEMLRMSNIVIDDGPLVDLVLKHAGDGRAAANAVGIVGQETIGKLIEQIFAVHARIRATSGRYDKALSDELHTLKLLVSGTRTDQFAHAVLERAGTEDLNEISILADLLSRHGASVERAPLIFAPETYDHITAAVKDWAETLLGSPEATRAQFAEIAQTAERLGSPELVPVLLELLSEDLARRKRAQEEWLEARKHRRQIQNDFRMSWTLQYQRAFAAVGDQQTIDAMKTYLRVPEFGFEAAQVLREVWRAQSERNEAGSGRSWPDFSVVPNMYKQRQSGGAGETHPFVDDIIAVIQDLIKPSASDSDLKHALKLATVAFNMPYAGKEETISALLELPVSAINKQAFLTVLVLSGQSIPPELVIRGIDDLLEEAKGNPWILQEQDGWRLMHWLRLLPFTTRPAAILEVLERAEGFRAEPWNLRSLFSALGHAPSAEAETVLVELARRDERLLAEYDWQAALANRNSHSAARSLLDLICNASFPEHRGKRNHSALGRTLSALIGSDDQFRQDAYGVFRALQDGPAKSILEYAIAEAADTEGVLLLTRLGAASSKDFRSTALPMALRNALVEQPPIESSGVHDLYSRPAPELRKCLFDMVVNGSTAEAQLATDCLRAIDEIRDDYGHVESEPRHPDISTGVPWPKLDLESSDARST